MKILIALLLGFLTGCSTMTHQDGSSNDPQKEQPTDAVPDIPYQVIENLIGSDAKPALIIYLHSKSGSGTDNKKQMTQVSAGNIEKYIKDNMIPAYFLVPQCPTDLEWDSRGSTAGIVSSGQAQFATPSLYTYLPLYITAGTLVAFVLIRIYTQSASDDNMLLPTAIYIFACLAGILLSVKTYRKKMEACDSLIDSLEN